MIFPLPAWVSRPRLAGWLAHIRPLVSHPMPPALSRVFLLRKLYPEFRTFPPATPLALLGIVPIAPASDGPSLLLVISVFVGLPAALWAYKCLMLVLFQRKIIYMGYVLLGSREESLADVHPSLLKGITVKEVCIPMAGKHFLSGITVSPQSTPPGTEPDVVVLYLQGNAGSPLHRLPVFQALLSPPPHSPTHPNSPPRMKILAVAPRGYWKSTPRRATQRGILADYTAILAYALSAHPGAAVVVYGHSLGGAAAVCLLAQLPDLDANATEQERREGTPDYSRIRGLVLENPFASIPGMVRALYPQRWLPYHHLAPLAWDRPSILTRLAPSTLTLLSAHDEVVPPSMGAQLHLLAGARRERLVEVPGALHDNAWRERVWRGEVGRYVADVVHGKIDSQPRP
ncbi:Alpha/Beta hydrolase protein [Mycena vulgaris]|nr:Alpha/Beta hydrolase protein [Mycena vulgaris]